MVTIVWDKKSMTRRVWFRIQCSHTISQSPTPGLVCNRYTFDPNALITDHHNTIEAWNARIRITWMVSHSHSFTRGHLIYLWGRFLQPLISASFFDRNTIPNPNQNQNQNLSYISIFPIYAFLSFLTPFA